VGDRHLLSALCASLAIHLSLLIAVTTLAQVNRSAPIAISVRMVEVPAGSESDPTPITRPAAKDRAQKIIAPKLLSKPELTAEPSVKRGNVKEEIKEPVEPIAQSAPLPQAAGSPSGGWNVGSKPGEAEGARTGGGSTSIAADLAAGTGTEGIAGGSRSGLRGLGRGEKGSGTGGGGASDAPTGLARPLGGYQVKPRYPDSARRAGVQGTTLLKVRVLENGLVGEVLVEQSAGHRDLDGAAVEAVKRWLFEPARMGEHPIAVWVLLPVKFELR
jgi:TonB family protein